MIDPWGAILAMLFSWLVILPAIMMGMKRHVGNVGNDDQDPDDDTP